MSVFLKSLTMLPLHWTSVIFAAEAIPIKIATGDKYWHMVDAALPEGGPLTQNIRAILKGMGYAPVVEHILWKRAYSDSAQNIYQATFPWFKDAERDKDFYFSDPILKMSVLALVRKDSKLKDLTLENIRGLSSCDLLGSQAYEKIFVSSQLKMIYVKDFIQCMTMLKNKRIDFILSTPEVAKEADKFDSKVIPNNFDLTLSLYLMVSRTNPDAKKILKQFNASQSKLQSQKLLLEINP
ncbi:MAG TPA: transporter substrate-binding domain-containing protein [Oligoflexus sp.]|uniref:substrate-binding periplasmic protein n=1 Tax=Oligoflexus sp. TaxID=1971216 RepID=UPI002D6C74E6|nr:transporter substrate-binding domain-containing protein [Oligoflexus sp.]HYX34689.1 transporter substrate-binding domain-containing protein [Oligoflexus sp.]